MTVSALNSVMGNVGKAGCTLPPTFDAPKPTIDVFNFGKSTTENTLPPTPGCTLPPTGDWNI